MKPDDVARVAHEVNRAYCNSLGDVSQPDWEHAPDWQKSSAINGVRMHLANPNATPEDSHKSWLAQKEAEGWKYGPTKDPEKKEHPCFVPYEQLPEFQRAKDYLFRGVVHALRPYVTAMLILGLLVASSAGAEVTVLTQKDIQALALANPEVAEQEAMNQRTTAAFLAMANGPRMAAAEPSILDKVLSGQFATAALGVVGLVLGSLKFLDVQRKRRLALATYHAFHIVEDMAAETEGEDVLDKVKAGLEKVNAYMVANGWRELKPGEEDLAKLQFSSLHGKQKAEEKVLAAANVRTAEELAARAPVGLGQVQGVQLQSP